jgi:ribosome modulation factor
MFDERAASRISRVKKSRLDRRFEREPDGGIAGQMVLMCNHSDRRQFGIEMQLVS